MWSGRDAQKQGKAPETSNFAQTCNLLSRYMKQKGSLRDLNLEIGGKVESLEALVKPRSSIAGSPSKSVNLKTNCGKSGAEGSSIINVEDGYCKATTSKEGRIGVMNTSQLTIFYSGKVLVFEDFPATRVKELVSAAKKSSSQPLGMSYGITSNAVPEKTPAAAALEGLPPRPHSSGGKHPLIGISSNTCYAKLSSDGAGPSISKSDQQLSAQSEASGIDLPIARRSSLNRFLGKRKDRAVARGPYHNQEHPAPYSKDEEQTDLNRLPKRD